MTTPTPAATLAPDPRKVGFIGLGHMGGGMARNLLAAGYDLVVHDLNRDAAAALEAGGARWAATPAEAGAGRDVVLTSLPAPPHVEQVLLGPDGLLSGMPPGSVWADVSTSVPAVADKVRELATPRGIDVLDAPVSGMAAGAAAGTLAIYVGGSAAVLERVRPVFDVIGNPEKIVHCGGHGAGYTVKLMLNLLWFAELVVTTEVLAIGTEAGVDLATLRRALMASPRPVTSWKKTCCTCWSAVITTRASRWRWLARISAWRSTWPAPWASPPRPARWSSRPTAAPAPSMATAAARCSP